MNTNKVVRNEYRLKKYAERCIKSVSFSSKNVSHLNHFILFFRFFSWSLLLLIPCSSVILFFICHSVHFSTYLADFLHQEYKWQCLYYGRLHIFHQREIKKWKSERISRLFSYFDFAHSVNRVLGILWAKIFIAMIVVESGLRITESKNKKRYKMKKKGWIGKHWENDRNIHYMYADFWME